MKKIIFLDIDGVLALPNCLKDGMWALCDAKQKLLGELLDNTDAKIVLSSSWRKLDVDTTKMYMDQEGFWFSDEIVGVTIRAYQFLEKGSKVHLSIPRGVEIKQWLDTHIHSNNGKDWERQIPGADFTYVIIDDDADMLLEQQPYFLRTDSEEGLTKEIVQTATEILNTHKRW